MRSAITPLRALLVTAMLAGIGASATARADGAVPAYLDPGVEGSLVDTKNAQEVALDSVINTPANVNHNGACTAVASAPATQASDTSPTLLEIYSYAALACQDGYHYDRAWLEIRYGGQWRPLVWIPLTANGVGGSNAGQAVAPCRAGTWWYHLRFSGSNVFATQPVRFTCSNPSAPLEIEHP